MHSIYSFISGPMVWIAFIVFGIGSLYRLTSMGILANKKDQIVYAYMSPYYALRSMVHWLIPFGSVNMRKHPIMTLVSFIFHVCLFVTSLFLSAHIVLINDAWDVSWWYLPDFVADIMTFLVIAACIYFMVRRITLPEVKFLTTFSDYVILAIVAAPFITGFWTYHQWIGYKVMGSLHILCGEIMIMAIPFTKLSHMLFYPLIRGYMGSEFGAVKHAKDW